jgi:hypothetical protein
MLITSFSKLSANISSVPGIHGIDRDRDPTYRDPSSDPQSWSTGNKSGLKHIVKHTQTYRETYRRVSLVWFGLVWFVNISWLPRVSQMSVASSPPDHPSRVGLLNVFLVNFVRSKDSLGNRLVFGWLVGWLVDGKFSFFGSRYGSSSVFNLVWAPGGG